MKVLLISVDGMRPDALANIPQAQAVIAKGTATMCATTVMPSVTLPCHVSLFHSVDPDCHGTTTNTYMPQVRPVNGLCEVLKAAGKTCAMFYNWEQLRDVCRPGSLACSYMVKGRHPDTKPSCVATYEVSNNMVTDAAIDYLRSAGPDFAFLYLAYSDDNGHKYGWMTPEYYDALDNSWNNIQKVLESIPQEYTVIITADHGGHDRTHGTDMPEDMTIPVIALGKDFPAGGQLENINLKDIAPTVTQLLGVAADEEWEGRSFLSV